MPCDNRTLYRTWLEKKAIQRKQPDREKIPDRDFVERYFRLEFGA